MQQQLRAAEREKSQLAAKKAELEVQLKSAQDENAEAKQKADVATRRGFALTRKLEAISAEKDSLQRRLADTEQLLEAERQKSADLEGRLATSLRQSDELRRDFAAEKKRLEGALSANRDRNERMYKLGFELIGRYEEVAVSRTEPFTGLRRAQIEKMAEEERDRFDKDRLPLAPIPERGEADAVRTPVN